MKSPQQIIQEKCPALSESPALDMYLEIAYEMSDAGFFGSLYNFAVALRACHLFTLAGAGGGGGDDGLAGVNPISSMTVGGMSVSYAVPAKGSEPDSLESTSYGKLLEEIIRSRPSMGVAGPY